MARSSSRERAFLREPGACSSPPLPRQKDALSSPNESFLQSERAAVSLLPILATTIPEFTVHETERDAELYSSLFVDLQQVSPVAIKNRKSELESAGYHPLGWQDIDAFLKALIQTISPTNGEFLDSPAGSVSATPTMWRDPVLFIRKRVAGIANTVDAIVDDIEKREVFPPALATNNGNDGGMARFGHWWRSRRCWGQLPGAASPACFYC